MVQVPAVIPVTVLPLMEQTLGVAVLKLTTRPEVAFAETMPVPPTLIDGALPKVMVWFALIGVTALLAADAVLLKKLLVAVTVKV